MSKQSDLVGFTQGSVKLTVDASSTEEDVVLIQDSNDVDVASLRINNGAFIVKGKNASQPVQLQTHDGNEDIEVDPDGFIKMETAGVERLRIDSNGNVGIGRAPDTVGSDTKTVSFGGLNTLLSTTGTSGKQNFHTGLLYNAYANGTSQAAIVSSSGSDYLPAKYIQLQGQHSFYTASSATAGSDISWTRKFHISPGSGGSFYFNTTSNQGTTGSGTLNIVVDGGDAINLRHTVNGNHVFNIQQDGTNPTNYLYFSKNGSNVGGIYCTTSSTSYNTSSDYRLKENLVELTGAVDRLKQIPVHRFNFISNPNTTVDGFLAHEVQPFVPEAVTGNKDATRIEQYEVEPAVYDEAGNLITEAVMGEREIPDYQSIDQSKLVPLLTAALQEALQKIDALEARVTALETN